ncbi:FAD-binding monooxygenase [Roseibium sp.]|uniref:FAD-binding monooxygenase n=1 Tax=Roseibium sp. TaxID=1936156 RepID=UPI003A96D309
MQFHLNGFRAGDPDIKPDARSYGATGLAIGNAEVDVLIVGTGPAGLTLAAQLSAFPGISTRIVERRDGPLELGQADGIACRTMEMFQAFGFAHKVAREAYWVNETTFWKPDDLERRRISRHSRVQDVEDGLSEFPHVILNQARIHDFYLEVMRNSPSRLEPDYGCEVVDLSIDRERGDYPVEVTLRHKMADNETRDEIVRSRYVVGCDGARSKVRSSIGRELTGDSANQAWGVMDVLCDTDFPDVRMKAAIQSSAEGNLLIIPREGGYLVRMYVEMDKLSENERVASRNIAADHLIAAARRILHPYSLEVHEVAWWSVYEIGQRICDGFDDVCGRGVDEADPRVFIAGDACHTHSPKAGQGMNVSMQDTFNLGWKLAHVLQGKAAPGLLQTYSVERQQIAQDLIDFDREWAAMFSAKPKADDNPDGVDPEEFRKYFQRFGRYTAGTATLYRPSVLTGETDHQALATGFPVGMRFHAAPVVRLADGKPIELGHVNVADGRWRVFLFAAGERSSLERTCKLLNENGEGLIHRYTEDGRDVDDVIDIRAVLQQGFRDVEIGEMPELLRPEKGRYGLTDYEKVFCADQKSGVDIFDMRGIDRLRGAAVIVRPDQYVGAVLPLEDQVGLKGFFDRVLLPVK